MWSTKCPWTKVLPELFPSYLTSYIPDIYRHHKKNAEFARSIRMPWRTSRIRGPCSSTCSRAEIEALGKSGVTNEQLLFAELQLLDYANRLIENRKDVTENRKISKALMALLFDEKKIFTYIEEGQEEHAQKVYSLVANVFGLSGGRKIESSTPSASASPPSVSSTRPRRRTGWVDPHRLFCSQASFDAKKREIERIQRRSCRGSP